MPPIVVISAVLIAAGTDFMFWCARRSQRAHEYQWVLALMAAGLVVAMSAVVSVVVVVRSVS